MTIARRKPRNRRGVAYVVVLSTVTLAAAFGVGSILTQRLSVERVSALRDLDTARVHARSGLEVGMQLLEDAGESWADKYDGGSILSTNIETAEIKVSLHDASGALYRTGGSEPLLLRSVVNLGEARAGIELVTEVVGAGSTKTAEQATLAESPTLFWSLADPGGQLVADEAVAGRNGRYRTSNMPGKLVNPDGGSAPLIESLEYVDIDHGIDLEVQEATFTMWVFPIGTDSQERVILSKGMPGSATGYIEIELTNMLVKVRDSISMDGRELMSSDFIQESRWTHIAYRFSPSEAALFVNGALVDSVPIPVGLWSRRSSAAAATRDSRFDGVLGPSLPSIFPDVPLLIGARAKSKSTTEAGINGAISFVGFFSRSLTDEEIGRIADPNSSVEGVRPAYRGFAWINIP